MTFLSVLATVFGVISAFANFPQIWKIFKTKSAKDISTVTYTILCAGNIVWLLYGFEINSYPIITLESLGLIEFIIILIGCFLYGKKKH